jgi:glycosyltransferase involved in cell wall biosynthesis
VDLVSVIIPSYNREKTIKRAVDSVLNQTYKNIEITVVDDCSTDGTLNILKKICDDRLTVVKLPHNSGACVARNEGIRMAKGKYIAFQDSDDFWHENKLEIQINSMKRNNALVSFCNFNKYYDNGKYVGIFPSAVSDGFITYTQLLFESIASTQCIVVDRKCLEEIKFDTTLPRLQDWDFTLELAKKYKIYHIDTCLVDVFIQKNSISKYPQKGIDALLIIKKKNKSSIENNIPIRHRWNVYMGNYVLETKKNPELFYKNALGDLFTVNIFIKYILCKMKLLIPIYSLMGKI